MTASEREFTVEDEHYVTAHGNDINNNNLASASPYETTEMDGSPLKPGDDTQKQCDQCGLKFESFTKLTLHKGKPCPPTSMEGNPAQMVSPVKISFPREQLVFCQAFLNCPSINKPIYDEPSNSGRVWIAHERDTLNHFLMKLYYAQISQYNLEQWYAPLLARSAEAEAKGFPGDLTPRSHFVALEDADLKVMQTMYTRGELGSSYKPAENAAACVLERKVATAMAEGKEYFVRLSTRSPKDTAEGRKAVAAAAESQDDAPAERLHKRNTSLKATSAAQVLKLLTGSMRIFADISAHFKYSTPGTASHQLNVILREWIDGLKHEREFRCFVHNRVLTCISQYFPFDHFDAIQDKATIHRIRDRIQEFHNAVVGFFPIDSYVMDVCCQDDRCFIIELNPFGAHMSSGSGLYNWQRDSALLYGVGKAESAPADIRVLRQLLSQATSVRAAPSVMM